MSTPMDTMTGETGNRGLQLEEKLIFEQNSPGMTAVDLPAPSIPLNATKRPPIEIRMKSKKKQR